MFELIDARKHIARSKTERKYIQIYKHLIRFSNELGCSIREWNALFDDGRTPGNCQTCFCQVLKDNESDVIRIVFSLEEQDNAYPCEISRFPNRSSQIFISELQSEFLIKVLGGNRFHFKDVLRSETGFITHIDFFGGKK